MSASCVISSLKKNGHQVIGCDIYPGEWHYESKLCDSFYQAPLAKSKEYVSFLLDLVDKHNIDFLFPLTDLEIDVLNTQHKVFNDLGCIICTSSPEVILKVRNKFEVYDFFKDDDNIPSIASYLTDHALKSSDFVNYPYIAKPIDGRSSEGICKVHSKSELEAILTKSNYLIQEIKEGPIFTVDVVRKESTNEIVAIPRIELLRTSNGAGLTVQMSKCNDVIEKAKYVAHALNINGCINMEFIFNEKENAYYLIDINPRFSAGIAFSNKTGNDLVSNHLSCFDRNTCFRAMVNYNEVIISKRYLEEIL